LEELIIPPKEKLSVGFAFHFNPTVDRCDISPKSGINPMPVSLVILVGRVILSSETEGTKRMMLDFS